jgi:hypothetical protein
MKFSPFFSHVQPVRLSRRRLKGTWLHARKFVEAIFSTLPVARRSGETFRQRSFCIMKISLILKRSIWRIRAICHGTNSNAGSLSHTHTPLMKRGEQ